MDESATPPRRPLTRTQRWLLTLLGTFGVWFVISVSLVIVSHVGGDAPTQYVLGTLVVALIPIMLVMLFATLWPLLRGDRTEDEQAVLTMVAREYPAPERPSVFALLDDYCATVPEAERSRVQRALLTLSNGDLAQLRYFTEETHQAYEDLVVWADEGPAPRGTEHDR